MATLPGSPRKMSNSSNRKVAVPKDQSEFAGLKRDGDLAKLSNATPQSTEVRCIPSLPAPEKFCLGMTFTTWSKHARAYVRHFPNEMRGCVLLGLLSGEALDIVADSDVLENGVDDNTFDALSKLLDSPLLPTQWRQAFHARVQQPGETVRSFTRELRRLGGYAFADDVPEIREKRILQQFVDGVRIPSIRRELLLYPPESWGAAVELAEKLERVDAAMRPTSSCCCAVGNRCEPEYKLSEPRIANRGLPRPRRPHQPYFRGARPRPLEQGYRETYPVHSKPEGERHSAISDFIPAVTCPSSVTLSLTLELRVSGIPLIGLIDTGACKSLIRSDSTSQLTNCTRAPCRYRLTAANGGSLPVRETVTALVEIASDTFHHEFVVADRIPFSVIIGMDLLSRLRCRLDLDKFQLSTDTYTVLLRPYRGDKVETFAIWEDTADNEQCINDFVSALGSPVDKRTLERLKEILRNHSEAFAWRPGDIGRTGVVKHSIDTGSARPIKSPPRRIPLHWQSELQLLIDEMLKKNVVRPSTSPWASPVVLVKKKDGGFRLCVDYRRLNEVTRKDAFPLPRIDDLFDALGGSAYFSTLDLASGYWQVEVEETDQAKTAFVVPSGLYEFQTMPFGLANAPATFQRLMQRVLDDLVPHKCLVYLDDVIVHGKTKDDHLSNLADVLSRLIDVGLKLQPTKCHVLQEKVTYLGHIISRTGIQTDPRKTEQVKSWPIPVSVDQLRSFLGLASYYRRFIKGFAEIAAPLNALLQKNSLFVWSAECQEAFDRLRESLCNPPLLVFPDISTSAGEFILDTDASDHAIGAVLSQKGTDGVERVVSYGSRSLTSRERNYCTTRKEMLALVFFIKQNRHYLLGRKFVVRTDHQSLRWLQNFKDPEGQIARWQEQLQEYDFECQHRPGAKHANADALSRIPIRNHGDCPSCITQHVALVNLQRAEYGRWQEAQASDPDISLIYDKRRSGGGRPTSKEMEGKSYEARCLWAMWEKLSMEEGVLVFDFGPTYARRIVVPRTLVSEVLSELHKQLGHAGINKLESAARQRFWWPHQRRDVINFCQSCETCATFKNPHITQRAPLQPIVAGYPNEIVGVDLIGPLRETPRGNRYILVMVDYFTKWCEAVPLSQADTVTVTTAMVNQWICQWGAPGQLHSDRGSSFESSLVRELCRVLGIDKTRTTAYHPQGNGQVERTNRSLKLLLKAFVDQNISEWDTMLSKCLLAYRSTVHSSTGQTPFFMWTGREVRLPSDIRLPTSQQPHPSVTEYVSKLLNSLQQTHQSARVHLANAHRRQKDYYDKKTFGVPLKTGDVVYLHQVPAAGVPTKLCHEWAGPYVVQRVISDLNCVIKDPNNPVAQPMIVHFNRLKPFHTVTGQVAMDSDNPSTEVAIEMEVPAKGGYGVATRTLPT
ncbi:unnamed protein product [Dicrocoelium dendriticum]|nr:unnamed protein product [Dicrocoelium dendriticum]